MTDAIHTVNTADDLAVDGPSDRERQAIAAFLSSGATAVVWLPEWLLDDKDVTTAESYEQLAIGGVQDYSEKALSFKQTGETVEYLPKSEVQAFELAAGVEIVETPQAGLADFE